LLWGIALPYIKLAIKFYMKRENIVLIGMAGVDKFTVGKPLSKASGLDFIDLVNDWRERK